MYLDTCISSLTQNKHENHCSSNTDTLVDYFSVCYFLSARLRKNIGNYAESQVKQHISDTKINIIQSEGHTFS